MQDVLRKIYKEKNSDLQLKKNNRQLQLAQQRQLHCQERNFSKIEFTKSKNIEKQYFQKKQMLFNNDFLRARQKWKIQKTRQPTQLVLPLINQRKQSINSPCQNKSIIKALSQKQRRYSVNSKEGNGTQSLSPQEYFPKNKRSEQKDYFVPKSVRLLKKRKRLNYLLRSRVFSLLFLQRLKKARKQTLLIKRKTTLQAFNKLPQITEKMVHGYYSVFLEQQLLKYLQLIKIKIYEPNISMETQVLNFLFFTSKKLKESSIVRQLMNLLALVLGQQSFFPTDFLTEVEAYRLQFNLRFGCTQNVTYEQSRMIVGVFVGIKIFCLQILYRPWLLSIKKSPIKGQEIIKNYQSVKKLIQSTASVFYYMILQSYCQVLELTPNVKQGSLQKFGYNLKAISNIYPQGHKTRLIEKSSQIFPNQNKTFYLFVLRQHPDLFGQMRENITIWLDRIVMVCIKENQRLKIQSKKQLLKMQQAKLREMAYQRLKSKFKQKQLDQTE